MTVRMNNDSVTLSELYENSHFHFDDLSDFDTQMIRKDLTFLRVVLDSVEIKDIDRSVAELIQSKGLYGFILEYKFPVLESVSKCLKERIQTNARSYNNRIINFRHRRVFKLNPDKRLWALWAESNVKFLLHAQLNAPGKFTRKQLASCSIPLWKLLSVPFGICQDIMFVGAGFIGSALLRIELGSHVRSLMERLDMIRDNRPPQHLASKQRRTSPRRPYVAADGSTNENSISAKTRHPRLRSVSPARKLPLLLIPSTQSRSSSSSPWPPSTIEASRLPTISKSYGVKLTVHSARRLPAVIGQSDEIAPSTYVSVVANNGHILCSPVCGASFEPTFNWTQDFEVSEKRQNLVVKLWQKCSVGEDKVLGFISIPLPPTTEGRIEYEMSNLMTAFETPFITISLTLEDDRNLKETAVLVDSPFTNSSFSPTVLLSRQELSEKLKKNLSELERLLEDLRT